MVYCLISLLYQNRVKNIIFLDIILIFQIKKKATMNRTIKADLYRYNGLSGTKGFIRGLRNPGFAYTYILRKIAESKKYSLKKLFQQRSIFTPCLYFLWLLCRHIQPYFFIVEELYFLPMRYLQFGINPEWNI